MKINPKKNDDIHKLSIESFDDNHDEIVGKRVIKDLIKSGEVTRTTGDSTSNKNRTTKKKNKSDRDRYNELIEAFSSILEDTLRPNRPVIAKKPSPSKCKVQPAEIISDHYDEIESNSDELADACHFKTTSSKSDEIVPTINSLATATKRTKPKPVNSKSLGYNKPKKPSAPKSNASSAEYQLIDLIETLNKQLKTLVETQSKSSAKIKTNHIKDMDAFPDDFGSDFDDDYVEMDKGDVSCADDKSNEKLETPNQKSHKRNSIDLNELGLSNDDIDKLFTQSQLSGEQQRSNRDAQNEATNSAFEIDNIDQESLKKLFDAIGVDQTTELPIKEDNVDKPPVFGTILEEENNYGVSAEKTIRKTPKRGTIKEVLRMRRADTDKKDHEELNEKNNYGVEKEKYIRYKSTTEQGVETTTKKRRNHSRVSYDDDDGDDGYTSTSKPTPKTTTKPTPEPTTQRSETTTACVSEISTSRPATKRPSGCSCRSTTIRPSSDSNEKSVVIAKNGIQIPLRLVKGGDGLIRLVLDRKNICQNCSGRKSCSRCNR